MEFGFVSKKGHPVIVDTFGNRTLYRGVRYLVGAEPVSVEILTSRRPLE